MIARIWRGWAPAATADDYQRHYETEVSEHLNLVSGFRGARLLRREDDQEVMFTSITFFTSLDAVRGFAGDDYEVAVVEETGQRALTRWDERVSHHEVSASVLVAARSPPRTGSPRRPARRSPSPAGSRSRRPAGRSRSPPPEPVRPTIATPMARPGSPATARRRRAGRAGS